MQTEQRQRQKQRGHRQQKVRGGESTMTLGHREFFLQALSYLKEKSFGDVKEFQERKPSEGVTRDSHRRRQRLGRRGLLTKEPGRSSSASTEPRGTYLKWIPVASLSSSSSSCPGGQRHSVKTESGGQACRCALYEKQGQKAASRRDAE